MGKVKKWNGSNWIDASVKKYNGSSWINADVKTSNGQGWNNISNQQQSKTWDCSFTQTYREAGTRRTDYRADKICQGRYVYEPWGIMRSLIGFDNGSRIKDELQGARIDRVELFLHNEHWYYYAGGTLYVGYHNHANEPDLFSHSEYGAKTQKFTSRGQSQWITLPNSLGAGIRDGYYKGVSVFANSGAGEYYGIFSGMWDGSLAPKLRITYTK
ncbi:hypothetical protein [Bacillus gaemokensis]|uniref:Uncharacterized protein n=1 Tax=Bacillus gaemokensis TaxID=574375 RepID=A0A073KBR4_9BACI|nr:hypothetical protein [Bacillus gaemokensis]KEK23931.1 hypothetical protein BAGA_05800 [Bacillus gaemokensis]KYG38054.1 hypothetical protein AZF08_20045 [Bacillus gaemokensis]